MSGPDKGKRKCIDEDDRPGDGTKKLKTETDTWSEENLFSAVYSDRLDATIVLKFILAQKVGYQSLEGVIQKRIVQQLFFFVAEEKPELQREAAYSLGNLAKWTSQFLIDEVPRFVQYSSSGDSTISGQAFEVLGELASKSVQCRDVVLGCLSIDSVLPQLDNVRDHNKLKSVTMALSFLSRNNTEVFGDKVSIAVKKLKRVINYSSDETTLCWSCSSLQHISYGTNGELKILIDSGVCTRLIEILHSSYYSNDVVAFAHGAIQAIVVGDLKQTAVYHEGLVRAYCAFLTRPDRFLVSEALSTLFLMLLAAGMDNNKHQYVKWIHEGGALTRIAELQNDDESWISDGARQLLGLI